MDLGDMSYSLTAFNNELEQFMRTNLFGPLQTSRKGPQTRSHLSTMLWLEIDTQDFGEEGFKGNAVTGSRQNSLFPVC